MDVLRTRAPRDVGLILVGAALMHIISMLLGAFYDQADLLTISTQFSSSFEQDHNLSVSVQNRLPDSFDTPPPAYNFPQTTIVSHAPGWTVFRNLYMSNGTLYVVSPDPASFPDIRFMTSTGLPAENTPENIALRMPTAENMDFLTPEQAHERWGGRADRSERNRVSSVSGNTFLFNDPQQFLNHYYHFCAELMFGAWAFWSGAFHATAYDAGVSSAPPVHRMIFANSDAAGWRDGPGINAFFLRAAIPSLTVEVKADWADRIVMTSNAGAHARAWRFDTVLLADRSAAFRGEACGSRTQRTAAEAFEYMSATGRLAKWWWEPIRRAVVRFAGANEDVVDIARTAELAATERHAVYALGGAIVPGSMKKSQDIVITYISRQGTRRRLIHSHHDALVEALRGMCATHQWELNIVQAEKYTIEQQLSLAARSTVVLGVHGNGLTHLIMMPPTPISTVIEIFYPTGFAHDYQWTTHALGMRHFAIWNSTYHTAPKTPSPNYPEGFQGNEIPVHPPIVVEIIEARIAGRLP